MTDFKKGDIVAHRKNPRRHYLVVMDLNDGLIIEATNNPAYVYKDLTTKIMWVRPFVEMEDGRFSLVEETK